MTVVEARAVRQGLLTHFNAVWPAGNHVLLGSASAGGELVVPLLSGQQRPRQGTVRIAGEDPSRSPATRQRLGVLLPAEGPFTPRTVGEQIRRALLLRGQEGVTVAQILETVGLETWQSRPGTQLGPAERRALALALALTAPQPVALLLHEPLAGVGPIDPDTVVARLQDRAHQGCAVVSVTSSATDAARLGGSVQLLEHGQITRSIQWPFVASLTPGMPAEFAVRVDQPRALCVALASESAVQGIRWDDTSTPGTIFVRGSAAEALSLAVLSAVQAAGVNLLELSPSTPSLELASASAAGLARAAYERAYHSAPGGGAR